MAKQLTFDDFISRIDRADNRLLKTLRKKLTIIALKSEREAKKNATDYPKVRTGRLRSSITGIVDAKDGNPRAVLRAGGNSGGTPVLYAKYVEFGTRKMAPRLFMKRGIEAALKDADKELRDLLSLSLQAQ
jgi:HK97 gp10 family phage protein